MDWFENWFGSPYYKILYQNRDEFEAQEFVEKLLTYLNPAKGCKMLDIACGEGRFARQLAEHGYDVTGIDISKESIRARYAAAILHQLF
jgi:2-polyprenyl-3-methyl-5-hydroxy-6-metoxy-1,4-benzoquinol methylase